MNALKIIVSIFLITLSIQSRATECTSVDISLSSQSAVDTFQSTYGGADGCDTVVGNLSISGSDITDIDGLVQLTNIGGDLQVSGSSLNNLDGLSNLSNVGGAFKIVGTQVLTYLPDFPALATVGSLDILANLSLSQLTGFTGLTSINNWLRIDGNDVLFSITGLTNLSSVGGDVHIGGDLQASNSSLISITGLSNLNSIGGELRLWENISLTNLNGFMNLQSVAGDLVIAGNDSLIGIDGFISLASIGGKIIIGDRLRTLGNDSLKNLNGLSNLTNIGGDLVIYLNDALFSIFGLSKVSSITGNLEIDSNASLSTLNGLNNIASISGNLRLYENASLANLDGLSGLISIGGSILVAHCDALKGISGLSSLTNVGDGISLAFNPKLTSLNGLSSLASMNRLGVSENPALTNLNGLPNLSSVGSIYLSKNNSLSNIDALSNLTTIEGSIEIGYNYALSNLNALSNLTSVGTDLSILDNDLTDCSALARVLGWPFGPPHDSVGGNITISGGNYFGCQNVPQILDSVPNPSAPVVGDGVGDYAQADLYFLESSFPDERNLEIVYQADCERQIEESISPLEPLAIPDGGNVESQLEINEVGPVPIAPAIEVDIDITHPRPRHLIINITSPAGTTLTLWNQGTEFETDLVGTFPVTLTPVDDLGLLEDEDLNGTWTISVSDVVESQNGVLNSWGIRIREHAVSEISYGSPIYIGGLAFNREYACTVAPLMYTGTGTSSNKVFVTTTAPPLFKDGFESGGYTGIITSFSASPDTIISGGNTAVSWTTDGASSCTASYGSGGWAGSSIQLPDGTKIIETSKTGRHVFYLTCNEGDQGDIRSTILNVVEPVEILSFQAFPESILEGESTTISWTTNHAERCTPSNGAGGWTALNIELPDGSEVVEIPTTGAYTFTLTCEDVAGSTTMATRTVEVTDATGCVPAPLSGETVEWQDFWGQSFPLPVYSTKDAIVPIEGYFGIRFVTGDVVDHGRLTSLETTVTDGLRLGSISECPGDFDVAPECDYFWGVGGGITWATDGTVGACQLNPNTTYYFNITFTNGFDGATTTCDAVPCLTKLQHYNP